MFKLSQSAKYSTTVVPVDHGRVLTQKFPKSQKNNNITHFLEPANPACKVPPMFSTNTFEFSATALVDTLHWFLTMKSISLLLSYYNSTVIDVAG